MAHTKKSTIKLSEIIEEHDEIFKLIDTAYKTLNSDLNPEKIETVKKLVTSLKNQLDSHFKFEEAQDVISELILDAPHCVELLQRDHVILMDEIKSLDEFASRLSSNNAGLINDYKSQFKIFVNKLKQHERHENELMMDAYTLDVGVGD